MTEALKPCPFCEGRARFRTKYSYRRDKYFTSVICTECGATSRAISSVTDPAIGATDARANAAKLWNRRPEDPTGEEATI